MLSLVSGKDISSVKFVSFKFDSVESKEYKKPYSGYKTLSEIIKSEKKIFSQGDKLHFASDNENTIKACFGNGIFGTIYYSYSFHIPLILRPDDLWISICSAFGLYVTNHAEEMRSCFVSHQGKKELVVKVDSPYMEYTTEVHWSNFIGLMTDEVGKNVKDDIKNWMTPKFSTTTFRDRAVSNINIMGAMKEYLEYKFMMCCGLSKVTLEGTLDDWEELISKAKYLKTFNQKDLNDWAELLIPVLEEFVKAYKASQNGEIPDQDFWQRICTSQTFGSGGQKIFRGWALVFTPFNNNGKYHLNPKVEVDKSNCYGNVDDDDIPDSYINIPVTVVDHDGETYKTKFIGGMMMTKYDNGAVRSTTDWGIIINQN